MADHIHEQARSRMVRPESSVTRRLVRELPDFLDEEVLPRLPALAVVVCQDVGDGLEQVLPRSLRREARSSWSDSATMPSRR